MAHAGNENAEVKSGVHQKGLMAVISMRALQRTESADHLLGETGAVTVYNHAQLMATLQLVPGE